MSVILIVIIHVFRFGGLGGNNGRQSWLKDDVLVSLSTPGPTYHMLLGVVGPLVEGC